MNRLINLSTYKPKTNKNIKNLLSYSLNALFPKKKFAFTLAEGATHVAMPPIKVKFAFTLAEVLITLGIIGVVAALTITSLINNYKAKQLEVQFKKADSIITQALKKTADEAGYDSIADLNIPGRQVTNENLSELRNVVSEDLNPIWLRQFTTLTPVNYSTVFWKGYRCHSMHGPIFGMYATCWYNFGDNKPYHLQDGLTITGLAVQYGGINHPGLISFLFDTNGPYNGPNRWGHDIFVYYSDIKYSTMCNPTLQNSGNQFGCYYWAKNNINPKDKSTPYWNVLYKPLSYWQKK